MKKEYDLTKLKVKRRGLLADLPPLEEAEQVTCVLSLDKKVVDFFQRAADLPNALPYQQQINHALQEWLETHAN